MTEWERKKETYNQVNWLNSDDREWKYNDQQIRYRDFDVRMMAYGVTDKISWMATGLS